jgi:GrpB-like predicted nucleotidyltransferase (UPF0157 family)
VSTEIRDYDRSWPDVARLAASELTAGLPGRFVAVEHIGSTAVPGLPAKPVIDLMAAADDLDAVTAGEEALLTP